MDDDEDRGEEYLKTAEMTMVLVWHLRVRDRIQQGKPWKGIR